MGSASTVREDQSFSSDSSSPSKTEEEHVGRETEEHSSNEEESEENVDEGSSKEEVEQMEKQESDEDEDDDEEVHENRTKNKEDDVVKHGMPEKASSCKRRLIWNGDISEDHKKKKKKKKKTKTMQSSHLALPEKEKTKTEAKDKSGTVKVAIHQLQPFQKVWNDRDETQLLKSLVRFSSKTGVSIDNLDMGKFHEYVKDSIEFDVSRTQVTDKIRRLRNKYNNSLRKGSIKLSNPHDEKVFRLSKKIWGGAENPQSDHLPSNSGDLKIQNMVAFDWSPYPWLKKSIEMGAENPIGKIFDSLDDLVLNQLMHTIPDSKLQKMEEELQKQHVEEVQLHFKSVELMGNHAKVFRAFMKYSFHGN